MQTRKKRVIKSVRFWQSAVWTLLLICLCVFFAMEVKKALPGILSPATSPTGESQSNPEAMLPSLERNPLRPQDFYRNGDYLSCAAAPAVLGIDVSFWQGTVDWQKVKAAGISFVMIRAGWRGSDQGVLSMDECAQANYAGAVAAGIQVGAYFFSQAISPQEAVEEAKYLLKIVKDWKIEMPLVFDWEHISDTARTANISPRTLTDCAKAFCDTVAAAGYTPMVYFNTSQSFWDLYLWELKDYGFWLAQYRDALDYPFKIDMWQYTQTGSVPGISGNVDIDLYFPWEKKLS